jgi:hypothetical protein
MKKTELVLAGDSKEQMAAGIKSAFAKKEFPALGSGAMCYMLSKQGHLNDQAGNWHPHLMFFVPGTEPEACPRLESRYGHRHSAKLRVLWKGATLHVGNGVEKSHGIVDV